MDGTIKKRCYKRTMIEWAIQARVDGEVRDVELFNKNTTNWNEPIETWGERIKNDYWWLPWSKRKYGNSAKLIKRTIIEEVVR